MDELPVQRYWSSRNALLLGSLAFVGVAAIAAAVLLAPVPEPARPAPEARSGVNEQWVPSRIERLTVDAMPTATGIDAHIVLEYNALARVRETELFFGDVPLDGLRILDGNGEEITTGRRTDPERGRLHFDLPAVRDGAPPPTVELHFSQALPARYSFRREVIAIPWSAGWGAPVEHFEVRHPHLQWLCDAPFYLQDEQCVYRGTGALQFAISRRITALSWVFGGGAVLLFLLWIGLWRHRSRHLVRDYAWWVQKDATYEPTAGYRGTSRPAGEPELVVPEKYERWLRHRMLWSALLLPLPLSMFAGFGDASVLVGLAVAIVALLFAVMWLRSELPGEHDPLGHRYGFFAGVGCTALFVAAAEGHRHLGIEVGRSGTLDLYFFALGCVVAAVMLYRLHLRLENARELREVRKRHSRSG